MANISLFIGGIRPLPESGRPTGMYKQPANGPLELGPEGFVGDQQADRRVHGGPDKAVHLYPAAHYARLAGRFPAAASQLVIGSMGENLSTFGLDETSVCIGDVYRVGSAHLQVSQPRRPCWKIDARYGISGVTASIVETGLTGWYYRVLETGEAAPGDSIELVERPAGAVTLDALWTTWHRHRPDAERLAAIAHAPGLTAAWTRRIDERLAWLRANPPAPSSPDSVA